MGLRAGLRAAQALCAAVPNEKKTIVSRVQREYVTRCSCAHDWHAIGGLSRGRLKPLLLLRRRTDARCANWASATGKSLKTRNTDTEAVSWGQNFMYRSNASNCRIFLRNDYRDWGGRPVHGSRWWDGTGGLDHTVCSIKCLHNVPPHGGVSPLGQLPAIPWNVLILNIERESSCHQHNILSVFVRLSLRGCPSRDRSSLPMFLSQQVLLGFNHCIACSGS